MFHIHAMLWNTYYRYYLCAVALQALKTVGERLSKQVAMTKKDQRGHPSGWLKDQA